MARGRGTTRVLATLVAVIGIIMIVAGGITYYMVHDKLADERITVSDDADFLAGDKVDGPFSAYAQAQVIQKHALKATGGKTYAELAPDDPLRETAMSGSFLRASLFTSVLSFGVAAMAIGVGIVFVLIGWALLPAPVDTVRGNTVRGNTVRDDTVRDDTVRDDTVRDDGV